MLNLLRSVRPLTIIKYHASSKQSLAMNPSETTNFIREINKQSWNPQITSFLTTNPTPLQISRKLIDQIDQNPLKHSEIGHSIIRLIKKDFKFFKPFYKIQENLKIMRMALRMEFPGELKRLLENYLIEIDDEKLSLPMLLLYESICQSQIKFSIGKDEELYEKLSELKKEDFPVVKEFLAIADIAESYFPSKIIGILCQEASKNIDKFEPEELIEVFKVVGKIKNPSSNFLIQSITPFLQKALEKVVKSQDMGKIVTLIQQTKKLKLDFVPLIDDINRSPENYRELVTNFDYRQIVDTIFRRAKVAVPKSFISETKALLLQYFQGSEVVDSKPLDYFMKNIGLLEQKHKPILSSWFDKVTLTTLPNQTKAKLIKFGSEFASKPSLTSFIQNVLEGKEELNFEVILNACWVIRIHNLNLDTKSMIFRHLPSRKSPPEDFIRLIDILYDLKHSSQKDHYITKLQSSLIDIMQRSTFRIDTYIKILTLYTNQTTFKENKKMYVHIQHSIINKWAEELPNNEEIMKICNKFETIKGGSKHFKSVIDFLRNGKREKAAARIIIYKNDLENNKFQEGSEWWV